MKFFDLKILSEILFFVQFQNDFRVKNFFIFEHGCADQEDIWKSLVRISPHGVILFPHKGVSFNLLHFVALESLFLPSTLDFRRIFMLVIDLLASKCQNVTC